MNQQNTNHPTIWGIIPAAGSGTRLNSSCPKQFLPVNGHYLLEHSLAPLTKLATIHTIYIAIQPAYQSYLKQFNHYTNVAMVTGGEQRAVSVYNALDAMGMAQDDDWVLIHDAVRPCLTTEDVDKLITQVADHSVGGLLATPVSNTVKKADHHSRVSHTVNREYLWNALTPQMFRYKVLKEALATALSQQYYVTDESSAVEYLGYQPLLVPGRQDNIKVTKHEDLQLATMLLQQLPEAETMVSSFSGDN